MKVRPRRAESSCTLTKGRCFFISLVIWGIRQMIAEAVFLFRLVSYYSEYKHEYKQESAGKTVIHS